MTEQALLDRDGLVTKQALLGRHVAVVGLGYVGLPTALSLADQGARITGCDISETRLADIKSGRVDPPVQRSSASDSPSAPPTRCG